MIRCLDPMAPRAGAVRLQPEGDQVRPRGRTRAPARRPWPGRPGRRPRSRPPSTITLSNVVFTGDDHQARCDTLLTGWRPSNGPDRPDRIGRARPAAWRSTPPDRHLPVGSADVRASCTRRSCRAATITYDRFDPMGIPIRAKVNITLTRGRRASLGSSRPTRRRAAARAAHARPGATASRWRRWPTSTTAGPACGAGSPRSTASTTRTGSARADGLPAQPRRARPAAPVRRQ